MKRVVFDGGGRCPYMIRWVLRDRGDDSWRVYLHKFIASDWSKDLHDHSSAFISIGLWGAYDEMTPKGLVRWKAPWMRWFPAEHRHSVLLRSKRAWTLCIGFPRQRTSGFWVNGKWVRSDAYSKSPRADEMKRCD